MRFSLMTKKLDDIHILMTEGGGKGSTTLCGRPFLGNDYTKDKAYMEIDKSLGREPRKACPICMARTVDWMNMQANTVEEAFALLDKAIKIHKEGPT